jgi:thioredoxin 1
MKTPSFRSLLIVAALLLAASFTVGTANRPTQSGICCPGILCLSTFAAEAAKPSVTNAPAKAALPRLVDLGADKCIPCKLMAPILEELKKEYEGRIKVEFIDVWKDSKAAKTYKINLIPTQIFYDAAGKELFRHEGFFSKEDIRAKWKELGVDLKAETPKPAPPKSQEKAAQK